MANQGMTKHLAFGVGFALTVILALITGIAVSAEWSSESWTAIAAWITALVALFAGLVAVSQLSEVRRQRREASQPYVAVYMRPVREVDLGFVDLVVENFGATAAHNVQLSIDPTPQSAIHGDSGKPRELWLPTKGLTLVPGQKWTTLWDYARPREEAGLPDEAEATVSFVDSSGVKETFTFSLDWTPFKMSGNVRAKGLHQIAKDLEKIAKASSLWTESIVEGGLTVVVRDGDAKDERTRAELETRRIQAENDSSG